MKGRREALSRRKRGCVALLFGPNSDATLRKTENITAEAEFFLVAVRRRVSFALIDDYWKFYLKAPEYDRRF